MQIMTCKAVRTALLGLLLTLAAGVPLAAQAGTEPGVDWTRVTERDLNVASVFLTARDRGPRAALDSLERLAAIDTWVRAKGHPLAHAIGRYAMEQRKDLAVIGECTPRFQSGCFHGVLEGYFLQGGTIDRASVGGISAAVAFAMRNSHQMVLVGAKRLPGKFLVIDLAGKLFARVPDAGSLPKTESLRIGTAKRADGREQ